MVLLLRAYRPKLGFGSLHLSCSPDMSSISGQALLPSLLMPLLYAQSELGWSSSFVDFFAFLSSLTKFGVIWEEGVFFAGCSFVLVHFCQSLMEHLRNLIHGYASSQARNGSFPTTSIRGILNSCLSFPVLFKFPYLIGRNLSFAFDGSLPGQSIGFLSASLSVLVFSLLCGFLIA